MTDVDRVVRITRQLSAPPARVFAAWIDPELAAHWLSPEGRAVAVLDARPGGALRVTMVGGERTIEHTGVYREVVADRRLVFTWESPYTGPGPSLVTVELEPWASGTRLTLVHERLPAEAVESHGGGWGLMLDRLDELLAEPDQARESA
jgi:uncharacterized protein YndB with AHSA1/START domain